MVIGGVLGQSGEIRRDPQRFRTVLPNVCTVEKSETQHIEQRELCSTAQNKSGRCSKRRTDQQTGIRAPKNRRQSAVAGVAGSNQPFRRTQKVVVGGLAIAAFSGFVPLHTVFWNHHEYSEVRTDNHVPSRSWQERAEPWSHRNAKATVGKS